MSPATGAECRGQEQSWRGGCEFGTETEGVEACFIDVIRGKENTNINGGLLAGLVIYEYFVHSIA